MSQRPAVKSDLSFGNPAVRAWLYQIIAVVTVLGIAGDCPAADSSSYVWFSNALGYSATSWFQLPWRLCIDP